MNHRVALRAGSHATDTSFRPVPAGAKDGPATGDKDGEGLDRCRIRFFQALFGAGLLGLGLGKDA